MNIFGTTVNIMNNLGIYAFAFLIPFILLYLIRPKVVTKTIPSLMFMMKEEKKNTQHSFLRKLMNNLIFFLQLLAILLLAVSVLNPVILTKDKATMKNTFIIVDGSASMQTKDGDKTRFEKAVDIAKTKAEGNVNLMVAYNNEVKVPVRDGWASEARKNLDAIKTEDTTTNIEAAMQKADQLLDKKNAKIIVISDFVNVAGSFDDPLKAKRILTGKGNEVDFIDVSSKADNVGIIDMIPNNDNTQVFVKNFNSEKKAVKITVVQGTKELFSETRNMLEKSTEVFTFPTPQGESYVLLSPDDDFLLDNKAYLSTPNNEKIKVILITSEKNSYLETALKSSKTIDLSIKSPPFTIEEVRAINPDVIIVGKINKNEIVVGDFENLAKYAKEGKSIIITAQEDMAQIDYNGLLPLKISGIGGASPVVKNMENQFTKDADFGTVDKYVKGTKLNGTTVMLTASDDSPLLSFRSVGNGTSVYYGIIEDMSDFKSTPSYPIFWNSIVKFLVKTEDIKDYNKKTTETSEAKVGYIMENGRNVAVNLLNEKESNVGDTHEDFTEESKNFVVEQKERFKDIPIEMYLIIAALVILVIELLVIKKRGDL